MVFVMLGYYNNGGSQELRKYALPQTAWEANSFIRADVQAGLKPERIPVLMEREGHLSEVYTYAFRFMPEASDESIIDELNRRLANKEITGQAFVDGFGFRQEDPITIAGILRIPKRERDSLLELD